MTTRKHTTERLIALLDKASMRAGNDNKLAAMIETTRHSVSAWRHDDRPCPIEAQVLLSAVAGENPLDHVAADLIERNANTPRGEKLISALGKGLTTASVAALITVSVSDVSASSSIAVVELLRCILC